MLDHASKRRAGRTGRILVVAAAVLLAGQSVGLAQAPAAPKVEVRGLRVVGDAYGEEMQGVRAFNWSKGTTVALLIMKPDGGIIEVNRENSKLTKFADDKGTDLTKVAKENRFHNGPFGAFPSVSPDGKACLIEITSAGVPAKGAAAISVAGTVSVRCGSKKENAKQENAALKPGTKIAAGPIAFEVSKVGKPEGFAFGGMDGNAKPEEKWEVTLLAKADCSSIAEIKFLDAAGKDMAAQDGGTSSTSSGGKTLTVEKSFILPKKVDSATVAITYWADMKEVNVPFDVKATVGLE